MKVFFAISANRERIGFRSRWITFVWYPRRGSIEAWLGPLGALRNQGKWFFTRNGQFILGGGMKG
jgi:hypothetical protein